MNAKAFYSQHETSLHLSIRTLLLWNCRDGCSTSSLRTTTLHRCHIHHYHCTMNCMFRVPGLLLRRFFLFEITLNFCVCFLKRNGLSLGSTLFLPTKDHFFVKVYSYWKACEATMRTECYPNYLPYFESFNWRVKMHDVPNPRDSLRNSCSSTTLLLQLIVHSREARDLELEIKWYLLH